MVRRAVQWRVWVVSLLDAEIQSLFGSVFGGIYLDGTIGRVTQIDDGFGGLSQAITSIIVKIQQDACTETQRLEAGYSPTDVRLLVLQSNIDGLHAGDLATVLGQQFTIGPVVTQDPARSYFECRGIRI